MTWRVLIADDEPLLRAHLAAQLRSQWPDVEIEEAAHGQEALTKAAQRPPDAAFLDIRMPGCSGLEVAQKLPPGVRVVFVTAYDQYAVAAFETAAVDYLLKPVLADRLAVTLERLQRSLQSRRDVQVPAALLEALRAELEAQTKPVRPRFLRVQTGREVHLLPVEEVVCFRADAKYTSVHTADREFLMRTPLKELEAELDPEMFWRVHRGTIVSARHVRRAWRDLGGRWHLTLDGLADEVRVSARYAERFRLL
ncbi:MAG: response regulator transcription factor [Gammaproteobacteria bacterium]|nr:response regulator transcription factor [Gammaproteobacteria bacterium]